MLLSRMTYKESRARDSLMCFHTSRLGWGGGEGIKPTGASIGQPAASILNLITLNYFYTQLDVLREGEERRRLTLFCFYSLESNCAAGKQLIKIKKDTL